jgi:hypothetical protein
MAQPKPTAVERLGVGMLAAQLGLPERTLHTILMQAGLKDGSRGCTLSDAARAAVQHYRTKSEGVDAQVESDRASKLRAERESAQMESAKRKGEIYLREQVHAVWLDRYTKIRVAIMNRSDMSEATKISLLGELIAQRVDVPEIRLNDDSA